MRRPMSNTRQSLERVLGASGIGEMPANTRTVEPARVAIAVVSVLDARSACLIMVFVMPIDALNSTISAILSVLFIRISFGARKVCMM